MREKELKEDIKFWKRVCGIHFYSGKTSLSYENAKSELETLKEELKEIKKDKKASK